MKASEFVKKFGWEEAKRVLNNIENLSDIDKHEFEELVDAWELVEKRGGLISARKYIKFLQSSIDIGLYHGLDDVDYKTEIPLVEQAIQLVESCEIANKRLEVDNADGK